MIDFNKACQFLEQFEVNGLAEVVSQNQNIVDMSNDSGQTLLSIACVIGNLNAVKVLVEAGSKLNVQDETGNTPLIEASLHGNKEIVSLLLESGANPNIYNLDRETALTSAVAYSHYNTVELLIEVGSNVEFITTKSGDNAITLAICNSSVPILKLLLAYKDKPFSSKESFLILKQALGLGTIKIVKLLMESNKLSNEINESALQELNMIIENASSKMKKLINK